MKDNNLYSTTEKFENANHLQPESSKPLDQLNQPIDTSFFGCFFF